VIASAIIGLTHMRLGAVPIDEIVSGQIMPNRQARFS
jgi:hypothetical protein